jgi:hypothetical protein
MAKAAHATFNGSARDVWQPDGHGLGHWHRFLVFTCLWRAMPAATPHDLAVTVKTTAAAAARYPIVFLVTVVLWAAGPTAISAGLPRATRPLCVPTRHERSGIV